MRFDLLLSFTLIGGLAACTAEPPPEGELPLEGDAGELGKADHSSLAVVEIEPAIDHARLEAGGTAIITTARAWERAMGTAAPAEVDFSKEWVAFFGTGLKNTGGFGAEITGMRLYPSYGALVIETHATSPGEGCIVTQAFTTPHAVVKFEIPSPRPFFALADASSEQRTCL